MQRVATPIVFYIPSFAGGGAERVMVRLANHLCHRGLDVSLAVNTGDGPVRALLSPDVPLHVLGAPRAIAALPRMIRLLRTERPGWIVAAMTGPNLVALAATRAMRGGPAVIACERNHFTRLWSGRSPIKARIMRRAVQALYPSAACVIGNAPGVTRDIAEVAGLDRGQTDMIGNPAPDPSEIAAAHTAPCPHPWLSEDRATPAIVAVGRLVPQKDYATMLEALAHGTNDARLLVLGDGPQRPALERQAAKLGIGERVEFVGWCDNRFDYLVRADLYVLSSVTEGFPNSLIEAVSCGVQPVSTDCAGGGAQEILSPDLAHNIVPVGDAGRLADAIDRALATPIDPDDLRSIAARYDIDAVADRFLERMSA